jgi:hypothetical protein
LPEDDPMLPKKGISCKTIFDGTVPFLPEEHLARAKFKPLDITLFLTPSTDPLDC